MRPLRVLVLEAQVPFVHGGAEILVRQLVRSLVARGHDARVLSIPFRDEPKEEIFAGAQAWRLLDLSQVDGHEVDVVIATKFPTYFAQHPRKVLWLVHQYRAAYELCGTRFSGFTHAHRDVALRKHLIEADTRMLQECVGHFTIAQTVSDRLERFNGIASEALYSPPKLASQLREGPLGDYVLTVTRLEHVKRVDLTIEAFTKTTTGARLLVAGEGSVRRSLQDLVDRHGLQRRVTLLGQVSDDKLAELYANCGAVLFAPFQEDYGYVTLEAFLSRKPVITASDSGGPLEFVRDGVTGLVCEPTPEALGAAVDRLVSDRELAAALGRRGYDVARDISWDRVVDRLLAAANAREIVGAPL